MIITAYSGNNHPIFGDFQQICDFRDAILVFSKVRGYSFIVGKFWRHFWNLRKISHKKPPGIIKLSDLPNPTEMKARYGELPYFSGKQKHLGKQPIYLSFNLKLIWGIYLYLGAHNLFLKCPTPIPLVRPLFTRKIILLVDWPAKKIGQLC